MWNKVPVRRASGRVRICLAYLKIARDKSNFQAKGRHARECSRADAAGPSGFSSKNRSLAARPYGAAPHCRARALARL